MTGVAMVRIYISAIAFFLLYACGPSAEDQAKIKALKSEVERLKAELEDTKFGAPRLLGQAEAAFEASKDAEARTSLVDLLKRHPSATESKEAAELLQRVDARIAATEQQKNRDTERQKEEERIAFERATQNIKKNTDEIEGIIWMSHKNAPMLGKYASLYFGTRNGSASMYPVRLRVQYYDNDWLFVRSLTVKADEKTYELKGLDFKRDNSSGSIWEWIDIPVEDHAMLSYLISAKKVTIRFHGDKYYSDFVLPQAQQNQMGEVYAIWKKMGGTLK
jgi:hypothetical protein